LSAWGLGAWNTYEPAGERRRTLSQLLERYVAVGTSISSGWRSDGISTDAQSEAWPVQLAALANRTMRVPDLTRGSCPAPILAPIALDRRLDGKRATASAGSASCRAAGVTTTALAADLALPGARTHDALATTPEMAPGRHAGFYRLSLPPAVTQVDAMARQPPTFVSVELGANEVFGVHSGVVISGHTLVSPREWAHDYDEVLARVHAVTDRALLIGLVDSLDRLPGFRRGDALWRERDVLRLLFHVRVASDCESSPNLLFVPLLVPRTIADGIARRWRGEPPATLGCADAGGTDTDYVLNPRDEARVNEQLAWMNAFIRRRADSLGFAYVDLDEIYARPEGRDELSVLGLMLSPWPFGPFVSADGVHPSAAGSRLLAEAAADAIVARYGGVDAGRDHSDRSATLGSTRDARVAGMALASIATASSTTATTP
jgi:hypothetical protein